MRVTCFFFYLVSHLVPPVFIILQKFLLKIQIAKKNFLGLQYQEQKIHNNYYNPSFLGLSFFWSMKLILCSVGRGIIIINRILNNHC